MLHFMTYCTWKVCEIADETPSNGAIQQITSDSSYYFLFMFYVYYYYYTHRGTVARNAVGHCTKRNVTHLPSQLGQSCIFKSWPEHQHFYLNCLNAIQHVLANTGSVSLKVTGNDTIPQIMCDFIFISSIFTTCTPRYWLKICSHPICISQPHDWQWLRWYFPPHLEQDNETTGTTWLPGDDKMLSYRRETALQGALVFAKSRRLELGDNILRTS